MFGKKNKNTNAVTTNGNGTKSSSLNTLVQGTMVDGNINTDNDIRIDGTLQGNLTCGGKAIIGPNGKVYGDITCKNAMIEGEFSGKLSVTEILTLKETAIIDGEASYDKLVVHQGAIINATIRRNNSTQVDKKSKKVVKKEKEAVQV